MFNKTIILAALLLAVSACTSDDEATRALQSAGYTNIIISGYELFGCDKNDGWHTGFTATGVNGAPVSGVVCSGVLKGATIRVY